MDKGKILIVDDEPGILKVTSLRLKTLGYNVLTAVDGKEALDAIRSENPDLVLLDLVMPFMDGAEVCEQIRNDKTLKHIPIILFTASGSSAMAAEKIKQIGADDYIVKPFEPEELTGKVEEILAQRANL
ncbi:MAG: response regulator [Phycisphaerae bacterium]|jgi:CheY-like chemotaxis protein